MYVPDLRAPLLLGIEVPPEEKLAFHALRSNLGTLTTYVGSVHAAVALFDTAGDLTSRWESDWRRLAAHQAIVSVYNYSMARKGAHGLLRTCQSVKDVVDEPLLERNKEAFKGAFPKLAELRQTVLHQGENLWNEERRRENSFRSPEEGPNASFVMGAGNMVSSMLADNFYVASFAGAQVRFEVSSRKALELHALCAEFLSAFPPNPF